VLGRYNHSELLFFGEQFGAGVVFVGDGSVVELRGGVGLDFGLELFEFVIALVLFLFLAHYELLCPTDRNHIPNTINAQVY
jgi:hypothetical protein